MEEIMPITLKQGLLAAALAVGVGGAGAHAQQAATYDASQLPAIKGRVAQYTLTPRGDVDGLILDNGTEVHFPPHLSTQLVYAVRPGDTVTIHGLKAQAVPMVQAMSVTNDASGQTVTDTGPPAGGPGKHGPNAGGQMLQVQGQVKEQLHGPRGDLNGVLLQDGTIVRLPPPEAQRLAAQLAPGQQVYAQGNGIVTPLGKVVAAQSIGPSPSQAVALQMPPPRPRHGHGPADGPGGLGPAAGPSGPPAAPGAPPPPPGAPPAR
jgi:hypothetical protein